MTSWVRSLERYLYSAFKRSRTSNLWSGLSSLIACFKVFKRCQTKGTLSQSMTSYCLSSSSSNSNELEAFHGYEVRTRRRKTPIENNHSITKKYKKERPVTIKTKKLDDSQNVQNWSFRSRPCNTTTWNWRNYTSDCRRNIKDSRKSAKYFILPPGDMLNKNTAYTSSCLPLASNNTHRYQCSIQNLVLSLLVSFFIELVWLSICISLVYAK